MNAIRIRTLVESTTLTAPELLPLLGKRVEIIILEEESQGHALLVSRGLFEGIDIVGDPVADTLADLRAQRAERLDAVINEIGSCQST